MTDIIKILDFLKLTERLKFELRHSWSSNGRQESVAEHTFDMSLIAILVHEKVENKINILKVLKMIIYHDLVEIINGDIPAFEKSKRKETKEEDEQKAIVQLQKMLPPKLGQELFELFNEFEELKTNEAKFAKSIDKIQLQIQHNLADIKTWIPIEYKRVYTSRMKHCEHDKFLKKFCGKVIEQAEEKMQKAGIDTDKIKTELNLDKN
ncbi:MAG: HD domain-containing protein [Alphaproteobacteria bacterium]|nr:MAG: hypothetical protein B6I23_01675 [Rickettsiaceae bacterium 4572_127]